MLSSVWVGEIIIIIFGCTGGKEGQSVFPLIWELFDDSIQEIHIFSLFNSTGTIPSSKSCSTKIAKI